MADTEMRRLTDRIAQEAARIMHEDGIEDPDWARRRAMIRLGIRDRRQQPELRAIERALFERQRLFAGGDDAHLATLRRAALLAMQHFEAFRPRLTGAVLSGSAGRDSPVVLHLHVEHPDEVVLFLIETGISTNHGTHRLHLDSEHIIVVPMHEFSAEGIDYVLVVLPMRCLRQAPLDEDLRIMNRASTGQLETLLRMDEKPDRDSSPKS